MKGVSLGRRRTLVGAGAGLAIAVAGIGAGAAYATSGSAGAGGATATGAGSAAVRQVADGTTPPAGQTPKAPGDHRRPPMRDRALRLGANVEHGELVVKTKDGTRNVSVQHGTVTEVTDHGLVVRSEDGTTWTYGLDAKTHVRKDGEKAAVGDLTSGDEVRVFADVTSSGRLARLVLDGRPPHPMRPGAPGAPAGPDQGEAPSTAPGATPSGLDGPDVPDAPWGADVLGA
ncbi:MAG: hypothetical protein ACTHQ3_13520 [Motilibacteraceae bacterium]